MNQLFHINTFSQISPAPSSPIESGDTVVVSPTEGNSSRINQIRTATATVLLSLAISAGAQDRPTTPVNNPQSTLIAQASAETDGKVYTAEVIQVDGTKKTVKYFRDKEGAIMPPTVIDGKLIDGSIAPDHPLRAKNAQVKILVKYDKNAQIMLALVSKDDILGMADKNLKEIVIMTNEGKIPTKQQLSTGFYNAYIIKVGLGHSGVGSIISGLEAIARIKMGINNTEINQIKQEAEGRAITIWKSTTGSMTVG